MKTTIVKHKPTGLVLYNGAFQEMPENADPTLFDGFNTIKHKGSNSQGIIDTAYFSPADYDKEEWDDEDDTTDDYEESEIEIKTTEIVVKYHNFKPDYSLNGHVGGYKNWFEKFDSEEDAKEFLNNLSSKYRGEIVAWATIHTLIQS